MYNNFQQVNRGANVSTAEEPTGAVATSTLRSRNDKMISQSGDSQSVFGYYQGALKRQISEQQTIKTAGAAPTGSACSGQQPASQQKESDQKDDIQIKNEESTNDEMHGAPSQKIRQSNQSLNPLKQNASLQYRIDSDQGKHQQDSNHMKFIQNYQEQQLQQTYKQAGQQNANEIPTTVSRRKSKHFFVLDQNSGENNQSSLRAETEVHIKNSRRYLVPPSKSLGQTKQDPQFFGHPAQQQAQQSPQQQNQKQQKKTNLAAVNNQISNFVNSDKCQQMLKKVDSKDPKQKQQANTLQHISTKAAPKQAQNSLAKILLTPWAEQKVMEKLETQAAQAAMKKKESDQLTKQNNRKFCQMTQMSQNGVKVIQDNPTIPTYYQDKMPMEGEQMFQFQNIIMQLVKNQNPQQNAMSLQQQQQNKHYGNNIILLNKGMVNPVPPQSNINEQQLQSMFARYLRQGLGTIDLAQLENGVFSNYINDSTLQTQPSTLTKDKRKYEEDVLKFIKNPRNHVWQHSVEAQESLKSSREKPPQSSQKDTKFDEILKHIDESFCTTKEPARDPEEGLYLEKWRSCLDRTSAPLDSFDDPNDDQNRDPSQRSPSNQNHFFMSLNLQGGQIVANVDGTNGGRMQSPGPALDNLGFNQNRKILSNRQKLMNKLNKANMETEEQRKSPYDGMFNIGIRQVPSKSNISDEGNIFEETHGSQKLGERNFKHHDNDSKERLHQKRDKEIQGQEEMKDKSNHNGQAPQKKDREKKDSGKQEKAQAKGDKSQPPSDFNLEYAQLIAKQFPIYDEKGAVIDYSNINEFQLELLALHEEYGETSDPAMKQQIFHKLMTMNEDEYYRNKKNNGNGQNTTGTSQTEPSTAAGTANNDNASRVIKAKVQTNISQYLKSSNRNYGVNVGIGGGNPEYKKNVIQLEKERLERERQELIIKRKRNSNYIQQCIRHGNEHYNEQKLNALNWLRKDNKIADGEGGHQQMMNRLPNRYDEKNLEALRKKQEIIAKYNKVSQDNHPTLADDGYYRFSILKGNNSSLIKRVLMGREYWQELEQQHLTLFSFKWAQLSRFINYEQLGLHGQKKLVNHLERHDLITTKDQLYLNMYRYCELNKINVFQYMPVQFVLDLSAKNFINEVDRFCQYFNYIERVQIKSLTGEESYDYDQQLTVINQAISQNKYIQNEVKYKNFSSRKFTLGPEMYNGRNVWLIKPNDFNRGRGVRLFNKLEQLRKLMKEFSLGNEMDFYMHNACCQILSNERQMANLLSHQEKYEEATDDSVSTAGKGISPMKWNQSGAAQGNQNQQQSAQQEKGQNGPNLSANVKSEVFVIQKYLERPLLIDERKFDIRLWVLINAIDLRDQRCYIFAEGYIRTSSSKFTLSQESIDQPFVHLTNNAVQQYDENYGKLEEGNQLSFAQAKELLKTQSQTDLDFHQMLKEKIVPVIRTTFKCVDGGRLNPSAKKHSFEIFGYDFMIDEYLNPWLIEVNTNPCLEETSALLRTLLPRMIDDAFKLTVDVLFPPPKEKLSSPTPDEDSKQQEDCRYKPIQSRKTTYPVEGYADDENMWWHIHTLKPQ